MPCYHPLLGYRAKTPNPTGKYNIVFSAREGYIDMPQNLPCGQCIGCRLERSRQWAMRCVHEASLYEQNCFITLTYAPQNLPEHGSLKVEHFQLFMKRLRSKFSDSKIRFFHCGEYGERSARPHYHALLFNFDFKDKQQHTVINDNPIYTSQELFKLWPQGFSTIGALNFETAAYTARYCLKKVTGKGALSHYTEFSPETGEITKERSPEYTTMSRRPGIGRHWFDRFKSDVFPDDEVVLRGKQLKPPKYYSSLFEHQDPAEHALMKGRRKKAQKTQQKNNTPDRLAVREEIQKTKIKMLKRNYENET